MEIVFFCETAVKCNFEVGLNCVEELRDKRFEGSSVEWAEFFLNNVVDCFAEKHVEEVEEGQNAGTGAENNVVAF